MTLTAPVGKPGSTVPNRDDDVEAVERLLQAISARGPDPLVFYEPWLPTSTPESVCVMPPAIHPSIVTKIENFQEDCGLPKTGVVDLTTLKHLNRVATPLILNDISTHWLPYGYKINYAGEIPASSYRVLMHVSLVEPSLRLGELIDKGVLERSVTLTGSAQRTGTRLTPENLVDFLKIISTMLPAPWSTDVSITLLVANDRNILITRSESKSLTTPVRPYGYELAGQLNDEPNLGEDQPIPYVGKTKGRVLSKDRIGGKYYFVLNNKFETNHDYRGFDCSSFVGSVFHIRPEEGEQYKKDRLSAYSTPDTLATVIGCTGEATIVASKKEFQEFFKTHKSGTYVAYGTHMVLVHNGVVCEFNSHKGTPEPRGYYRTNATEWPASGWGDISDFTIRKTCQNL